MTVAIWIYAAFAIATAVFFAGNFKTTVDTAPKGMKGLAAGVGATTLIILSAVWPVTLLALAFTGRKIAKELKNETAREG